MERVNTWSPLQQVDSADLNAIQDQAWGAYPASQGDIGSTDGLGMQSTLYIDPLGAGTANGSMIVLDDRFDYRDRLLDFAMRKLSSASQIPGGAYDSDLNVGIDLYTSTGTFMYTGEGGLTALGAAVSNGNPPVNDPSVPSWAIPIYGTASTIVWLFAAASNGVLCLYNASGATLRMILRVTVSGKLNKRP